MKRRWIVAALLLSTAVPACASTSDDGGSSEEAAIADRIGFIRFARLQESIAPLYRAVVKDPTEVGDTMRKTLDDTEVTFAADRMQNRTRDMVFKIVRNAVVSLGKNKLTRRLMVESSVDSLTRRSNALKQVLTKSNEVANGLPGSENVFDELVIGMGPQGVAYMQAMTDLAPTARILAVDAGKRPGGTFADVNGGVLAEQHEPTEHRHARQAR